MKKGYNIKNYNCESAFKLINDRTAYFEESFKAQTCFKNQKILEEVKGFEDAFIICLRGIQLLGNALLLKERNLKSKDKNCQFQYLFNEDIISEENLEDISLLAKIRNDIYYNNESSEYEINEESYKDFQNKLNMIKKILEEKIEK